LYQIFEKINGVLNFQGLDSYRMTKERFYFKNRRFFSMTSVSEALKKRIQNSFKNSCCLNSSGRRESFRDFRILNSFLAEESEVLIFDSFHQGKEY